MKQLVLAFALSFLIIGCQSRTSEDKLLIVESPLKKETLKKHIVASDDYPMSVWQKKVNDPKGIILFVHGRTWSSVPDFDLQVEGEDLSLMDGMNAEGYTTYAVDLRGYGETPRDSSGWTTPLRSSKDIANIISWISKENENSKVHLFGWSNGSTVSLLTAQNHASQIASLTVFGYWMDLDFAIPEDTDNMILEKKVNTAEAAASDFIIPGSISQKAIDTYVKMALEFDPIRTDWKQVSEFNSIDPSKIELPVLILQGEFDPIAPTDRQAKLFTRLKTADKSWVVISRGDHAAFMETPRPHFIKAFSGFIDRFNDRFNEK